MKILIIEDEKLAADRLADMVCSINPRIEILQKIESVERSLEWLATHPFPDLVFMDIHLADGEAFDILEKYPNQFPIIFCTAFDEYALSAFQYHSLDYLLKPIKRGELASSIQKLQRQQSILPPRISPFHGLNNESPTYQSRILLRYGKKFKALEISEIAYFYIESKATLLKTWKGQSYGVDQNLDQLTEMLNPKDFFRLNRQLLVSFHSIKEMHMYSKARVKVVLNPSINLDGIVSSERSANFKKWLEGNN